jgi:hypothetical protein
MAALNDSSSLYMITNYLHIIERLRQIQRSPGIKSLSQKSSRWRSKTFAQNPTIVRNGLSARGTFYSTYKIIAASFDAAIILGPKRLFTQSRKRDFLYLA